MRFASPLTQGKLIHRYKRFLADIELHNGDTITVSVPNTGSMLGLDMPGANVWLSHSSDLKRKYPYRLELVEADNTIVGINTGLPNKIAREALETSLIPEIEGYQVIKPEQKYAQHSRIDFLLQHHPNQSDLYLEVKNVHFIRQKGLAEFPDTVTDRGARHLDDLVAMRQSGYRAAMVFIIQREDCNQFKICDDLDPVYGQKFVHAIASGVEAYAIKCHITPSSIIPTKRVDIIHSKL